MVKETQKIELPRSRPVAVCIFSRGVVMAIKGSCMNIPRKATPVVQVSKAIAAQHKTILAYYVVRWHAD